MAYSVHGRHGCLPESALLQGFGHSGPIEPFQKKKTKHSVWKNSTRSGNRCNRDFNPGTSTERNWAFPWKVNFSVHDKNLPESGQFASFPKNKRKQKTKQTNKKRNNCKCEKICNFPSEVRADPCAHSRRPPCHGPGSLEPLKLKAEQPKAGPGEGGEKYTRARNFTGQGWEIGGWMGRERQAG